MQSTDYSLAMKRCIVEAKRDCNIDMLAIMESEADFIFSCMESMSIIDGYDVIREAKETTSIWEKLKAFFNKIFEVFTNKTKKMFDIDIKWLNANSEALRRGNYDGLSIEMYPYWNMPVDKIKSELQNATNKVFNDIRNIKRYVINAANKLDKDNITFNYIKRYDDGNGNTTEGFKNYLRTGNAKNPKATALSGAQIKSRIDEMIKYCTTYNNSIVPYIKKQMDAIDREVKKIETTMKSVKEHTIFIEDSYILETSLRYCTGVETLLEADNDDKPSPTQVKVTSTKNDENNTEKNTDDNKPKEKDGKTIDYSKHSKYELRYLNEGLGHIKLMLTATMSVFEERYIAYMKALRSLHQSLPKSDNKTMVDKAKVK